MTENAGSLMEIMHQGGWVMWALLAFSIIAVGTAIERVIALHRAGTDLKPFLTGLRDALIRQRSDRKALEICDATRGAAARVAKVALQRFSRPTSQLERALEHEAVIEVRRLSRGMVILATVANVAPLLGFLGTVTGMIESFAALWRFGLGNPQMVALGISEALLTTAAGLMVAVPTQIVYNALGARVDKITADVEAVANFLLEVREEVANRPSSA